ncbi:MAG TPA: hypothetical protein VFY40_00255 [Blastocatellia bacterium]|nr:hypothetical protein [Blastocatellia bacterium]
MTPKERKEKFDALSSSLLAISNEIESLTPELSLEFDQKAARAMVGDLYWAVENCTTIGLHQIGKALDDRMGY